MDAPFRRVVETSNVSSGEPSEPRPEVRPKAKKPRGLRIPARLTTRVIRPLLRLLVILRIFNVTVINRPTKLIKAKSVLVVANHCSDSDPFFLGGALRRPVVFVAKKEIWGWPIAGWFMRLLGEIPVDRKDSVSRANVQPLMTEVVKHGGAGIVFPEGTTHDLTYQEGTPVIGALFQGVARIAYATDTAILVCGMRGTRAVLPPRKGAKLNRMAAVVLNFETELIDPVKVRKFVANDDYLNPSPRQKELIIEVIMYQVEKALTERVTNAYREAGITYIP